MAIKQSHVIIAASLAAVGIILSFTLVWADLQSQVETLTEEKEAQQGELEEQQIQLEREETIRLQQQRELEEQQIQAKQERQRLEAEMQQQQIQAEQELKILEEQKLVESEKSQIRLLAESSPILTGLINGELTFYVNQLPSYVSSDVREGVESLASSLNGKYVQSVKLKRVYSTNADFTVNWVKDYQEEAIGRQIGSHLLVGLGRDNCLGEWKPFDEYSVKVIMWQEIGHALGYDHTSDEYNVMYPRLDHRYEYEYDETITLRDGWWRHLALCASGEVFFTTERVSSTGGYKVYVLDAGSSPADVIAGTESFYADCSGYEDNYSAFSKSCNVESGSTLVLYNPSLLGFGNDIEIKIKIRDVESRKDLSITFDNDNMFYSQEYLNYVRELFGNKKVVDTYDKFTNTPEEQEEFQRLIDKMKENLGYK